jgi:hypothetical protein
MSDAMQARALGTRVLLAIEGPHEAARLTAAVAVAVDRSAVVEIVHVGGFGSDAGERAAWGAISDAITRLRALGIEARGLICHAQHGTVAAELAIRADELAADLVVVGSGLAGRAVPSRWSICRAIPAIAGRPVLIVPDGHHHQPGAVPWVTVHEEHADGLEEAIDRLLAHPDRPEILVLPPRRHRPS